ncbi:MAG: iron ABC transporter permease [Synergistaceae bacterium]|jgi:iron complex transport system permease protein|nr:iron ABC transporter permease [Synergistaceae bacterium]
MNMRHFPKFPLIYAIFIALMAAAALSATVGRYYMPLGDMSAVVWARISGHPVDASLAQADVVLFTLRIPRIALAVLVGAALALSGAAYQSMFQNPIVSPDVLGVTHAAGVGAAAAILLDLPSLGVHLLSFAFGICAVTLVLLIAGLIGRGSGRVSVAVLVLTGMVITFFFQSLTSLAKYVADSENKLPEITFWLMGSFARANSYRNVIIMLIVTALGATPLFLLRWQINAMSFGDEEARSIGVNVRHTRVLVIICSTLLTASSVSLCGSISWVGLVVPHIVRLAAGPNNDALFPASMLAGGLFLLIVDDFSRVIVPGELPISILTSMIGAPLFIYMLFRGRREWI